MAWHVTRVTVGGLGGQKQAYVYHLRRQSA